MEFQNVYINESLVVRWSRTSARPFGRSWKENYYDPIDLLTGAIHFSLRLPSSNGRDKNDAASLFAASRCAEASPRPKYRLVEEAAGHTPAAFISMYTTAYPMAWSRSGYAVRASSA